MQAFKIAQTIAFLRWLHITVVFDELLKQTGRAPLIVVSKYRIVI